MRLTLAILFTCWTIYCSSITAVLSLPPSLIANAASLHQQQEQQHTQAKQEQPKAADYLNGLWIKDVKATAVSTENEGGNVLAADTISEQRSDNGKNTAASKAAHPRMSRMANIVANTAVVPIDPRSAAADAAYDLKGLQQDAAINDDEQSSDTINNYSGGEEEVPSQPLPMPQTLLSSAARAEANEFFTPLKYWARHCQPGKNCPKQNYRALLINNRNSNKETPLIGHPKKLNAGNKKLKFLGGVDSVIPSVNNEFYDDLAGYDDLFANIAAAKNYAKDQNRNNDIFMYLNGEQDVIKFLTWAMQLLYPHANYSTSGADHYHPGMFIWKKLNMSGSVEPPFYVEEPRYIIVRREQLGDDFKMKSNSNNDDPFIPPRGRKHNMPDLDALLHRYETFVPNRGRRNKIKEMLKSDDLFFPNRGKRLNQPPTPAKRDLEYENDSINHSGNSEKNQHKNKNDDEVNVEADGESKFNIDDNIENESSTNDNANNNNHDSDDDWSKTLPLVLIMRDTLAKLWHKKLQNQHERLQNAATVAAGNKITRNAHEINYFSDNSNNPEWLPAMLNYKFNGYDPTGISIIKQSMPMAMAINGETREMSTPKATKNDALMQLMLQQPQLQQFDAAIDVDEIATGNGGVAPAAAAHANGISVDSGAAMIGANRLLSTRSMSTAMAHRRQQQLQLQHRQHQQQRLQRQRQLQQQRRLAALSQELNANAEHEHANWQEDQKFEHLSAHQDQHQPHHHQPKLFTDLVPLLWRQLQLLDNSYNTNVDTPAYWQHKRKVQKPFQPGFWPQEALRRNFLSKSQRAGLKGDENSAFFNDYNYFDI